MEVNSLKAAKQALINRPFFDTARWQQQQERADRLDADPEILEFEKRFIAKFRKMSVPMFSVYLWRSPEDQERLYFDGRSKARAGHSPHNYGMAVDIVHSVLGWQVPKLCWEIIEHVGKETALSAGIDITWGGDFKSIYDPAHWELTNWRDRPKRVPHRYVF